MPYIWTNLTNNWIISIQIKNNHTLIPLQCYIRSPILFSFTYNLTYKYNFMDFYRQQQQTIIFTHLFNEEHAAELIANIQHPFKEIIFKNVGIKVMRLILQYFEEAPIAKVTVDYNWNTIMTTPQLICYDKNQWKTLQQLANWNREWNELFSVCFSLLNVELKVSCSWMDDQFARKLLQGVVRLPNINTVTAQFSSKNKAVEDVLSAFSKAGIFANYRHKFVPQQ